MVANGTNVNKPVAVIFSCARIWPFLTPHVQMFKLSLWGDFYYLFQNKSKAFFNFIQDEQTNPQNAFKELDYLDKNKQE